MWGDTHIHTNLSADAYTVGNQSLSPSDAFRFARGEEVISEIGDAHGYDMAVLVTAHNACLSLDWATLVKQMRTPLIYDGRRVLDLDDLTSKGWKAYAVGRPV